jgi:hypothetical protein
VSRWMDTLDSSLRTSRLSRTTSARFSPDNDCLRRSERRAQGIYTLHEHLPLSVRLQCGLYIRGRTPRRVEICTSLSSSRFCEHTLRCNVELRTRHWYY